MGTESDSRRAWTVAESGRATGLVVHLRQKSYVLPWSLFLSAEGTDGEVRVTFHTHVVLLQGAGLASLLSDLAAQVVTELVEPDRTAKFTPTAGPTITAVTVSANQ
ncbi:MAG: hypothetical protein M3Y72_03600 [Acidobacteriota bacterium]|nr:hypothetical protein [Acidobacteriota bacterium]